MHIRHKKFQHGCKIYAWDPLHNPTAWGGWIQFWITRNLPYMLLKGTKLTVVKSTLHVKWHGSTRTTSSMPKVWLLNSDSILISWRIYKRNNGFFFHPQQMDMTTVKRKFICTTRILQTVEKVMQKKSLKYFKLKQEFQTNL